MKISDSQTCQTCQTCQTSGLFLMCYSGAWSRFRSDTFLALRSLFRIGMSGVWGLAAATAPKNLPVEARGIASGFLQQGYVVGYLFAACFW